MKWYGRISLGRLMFVLMFCGRSIDAVAQPVEGLISSYYFSGNARDTAGPRHGKVFGPMLVPDRFGNPDAAYAFDGEDDYINLGTGMDLKQVAMTISLWVKITDYETNTKSYGAQPIVFTRTRNADQHYEAYSIGMNLQSHKIEAFSSSLMQEQTKVSGKEAVGLNEWYHVVYMFNDDTVYLYQNGEFQQKNHKGFFSHFLPSDSVMLGYIGNYMPGHPKSNYSWLHGELDDLKFYDRILSPEEILELYREPDPKLNERDEPIHFTELLKTYWYVPVFLLAIALVVILILLRLKYLRKRGDEKKQLQHQVLEMEMTALRGQMNPHFIFNSLNSIHRYILKNDKKLASIYLLRFSQLIRNILDLSKSELISLNDELSTITLYLEIEALRFENAFTYQINSSNNVDGGILLPPLIIQPFVENAIWHGLLPKKGEKKLFINVSSQNNQTILEIDDNGIGREASRRFGEGELKKRKSFGIEITSERLEVIRKVYGIDISFQIIDKGTPLEPEGTKVIIRITQNKVL